MLERIWSYHLRGDAARRKSQIGSARSDASLLDLGQRDKNASIGVYLPPIHLASEQVSSKRAMV
jgi:hypothetical protein